MEIINLGKTYNNIFTRCCNLRHYFNVKNKRLDSDKSSINYKNK